MKLTKGMKKALSLLLSAAMVVTGVNVTAGKASAEETTATPSKYVLEITTPKEGDGHNKDTNENLVTKLNGEVVDFYGHDGDDMTVDGVNHSSRTFFPMEIANKIAAFKQPVYKVTSLTEGATLKLWDFCWNGKCKLGDQEASLNNSYIKNGEFWGNVKDKSTFFGEYKLGETEIGIDLSEEYEDGEAPAAPDWNGGTFLGFGLDFGASATIEIYDTAEEEIEPSLLPEQSSTPAPPVATPSLEPSFRPAVISTVAPLPEQSNIPAGVPGSNVTPEQSSVPSVSKKVKVSGRKYNSQRLTFRVKGKKKGNTVIYVIIGEKSRKIKVICL